MRLNCDDDNENDIIDKNDSGEVDNEDDLIWVYLYANGDDSGNVTIERSNSKIKLYKPSFDADNKVDDSKAIVILGSNDSESYDIDFFETDIEGWCLMEGYEAGITELEISFDGEDDKAKITVEGAEVAVDGNRDGELNFDNEDDKELIFWVNNDHDDEDGGEEDDVEGGGNDCDDNEISCKRDLEDFARIHFKFGVIDGSVKYYVKFNNITGNPKINLFENIDHDGGDTYLTLETVADSQKNKNKIITIDSTEREIPIEHIYSNYDGETCYLFEGANEGAGELIVTAEKNGVVQSEYKIILRLLDPDYLFDYYKVICSDPDNNIVEPTATRLYTTCYPNQNDDYLLFVHGWNMDGDWEKKRWAQTIFKRLYWLGYKGKVGLFSWPELKTLEYDRSEFRGWRSAVALKSTLDSINGNVCTLAHSQGNVVASEALNLSSGSELIDTFISSQAAISGHCFDNTLNNYWDGYTTPEVYGSFPNSGLPYLNNAKNSAGKRVRFYNHEDYALVKGFLNHFGWQFNNETKPDIFYNYDNNNGSLDFYIQGLDRFYYGSSIPGNRDLLFPDDRHEIFSFCAESRSTALGSEANPVSWFTDEFDLQNYGYDAEHYSHSRQFRSTIQKEKNYWEKVKTEANFN